MDRNTVIRGVFDGDSRKCRRKIYLEIERSREILEDAYRKVLGPSFVWLPEYEEIAKWMSNNGGKGLFMYGSHGRGKTTFLRDIFPVFMDSVGRVATYYIMTTIDLKEALSRKIICLDDVGVESKQVNYGNERHPFPEIMDMAEQNGNLVIASSNMNKEDLLTTYGKRTMERIISCCYRVNFNGNSMRK